MIRVTIHYDAHGALRELTVSGHAGFAESGSDVVCAAVSVLTINTLNSLERFVPEEPVRISDNEEAGEIRCEFEKPPGEKAALLMDSLIFGLKNIQEEYGKQYCTIIEKRR